MDKMKFKTMSFAFTALCALAWGTAGCKAQDPLLFPKDSFTVETKTVNTSSGEKKVTYRSYMHILYVANPVNKDYQSMNVSVPIMVDDVDIDANDAPIFFNIGVGGYMSCNNANSGSGPRIGGGMGTPPAGTPPTEGKMGGGPGGPGDPGGPGGPGGPGRHQGGMPQMAGGGPGRMNNTGDRSDLALAAGYVVVSPGCRGRDNKASDGTFYGKAPAVIVDLKAAVRYIRHNKGILPGNVDKIISVGCSAGGAISALLGASGNSPLYDSYLKEIGAADENDNIFGSACYSPITDLEHADGAYEWMYGTSPINSGLVDQELSKQLKESFVKYQASLNLQGKNNFGTITADNYDKYLLQYYLTPSANKYLRGLTDEKRKDYLANNKWMVWTDGAVFSFADYVAHVGRMKDLPAFDDFGMKQAEPMEFGNITTDARHFTNFSLQHATGNKNAEIDNDLKILVNMMNPMYFIDLKNNGCASNWWLRNGSSDAHTSQTVMVNLATSLEDLDKNVNTSLFWDGGHCADEEPENLIKWMGKVTGYSE
jgi:hypothetical protein